jgi:hypothetical protein
MRDGPQEFIFEAIRALGFFSHSRSWPRTLRVATFIFAGLMVLNGAAHITGAIAGRTAPTVRFEHPMPG